MGKRLHPRLPDEALYKSHTIEELEIDLAVMEKELKRARLTLRELQLEKDVILSTLFDKKMAARDTSYHLRRAQL